MTLTLELTPELEAQLHEEASRQGFNTTEYALRLLSSALTRPVPGEPTLEELEAMFAEMAEGHENRPVLAPEAATRAGIYAEHD